MTLDGSFCHHHLPGKKVLYVFIFASYTENIQITIHNIFEMCMDMYAFFYTVYVEFIQIMYGYAYHVCVTLKYFFSTFVITIRALGVMSMLLVWNR